MRTTDSNHEPKNESDDGRLADEQLFDGAASEDGTALSEDPVLASEPDLPNDQAPKVTSPPAASGASAVLNDEQSPASSTRERNWMGYVAYVAGALALSLVAIVLGHLGLSATRRGRASNRDFGLAGVILGYVGLVATAVGLWFVLADQTSAADVDVQAQQDVSAVGAAAATVATETSEVPDVTQTETGYVGAGQVTDTHRQGARELTMNGDGPADWCLDITYEGGEQAAFSYTATHGMAQGRCA